MTLIERKTRRYLPRARFYEKAKPSHPEFLRALLSEEMLYQSTIRPGKRDSIRWITLRPEDKIDDPGMPGREPAYSTYRPPALLLNYGIRWKHTYNKGDWSYQPSTKENEWRDLQLATYKATHYDLSQKKTPSEEDKEEIKTLNGLIEQLRAGGEGYLETGYDMLGSGVSGITWGLEVPNIPITVTSTFLSQKNRGQSFRLKRLPLPDLQVVGVSSI